MTLGTLIIRPVTLHGLTLNGFPTTKTYITCSLSPSEKYKTSSVNGPVPEWQESLGCTVSNKNQSTLNIEVYNEDPSRPGKIGIADYDLDTVYQRSCREIEEWIPVRTILGGPLGSLLLHLKFVPLKNTIETADLEEESQQFTIPTVHKGVATIKAAEPPTSTSIHSTVKEAPTNTPALVANTALTVNPIASAAPVAVQTALTGSMNRMETIHTPHIIPSQHFVAPNVVPVSSPLPPPIAAPTPAVLATPVTPSSTVIIPQPVSAPPLPAPPTPLAPPPLPPTPVLRPVPEPVMPKKKESKDKSEKKGNSSEWIKLGGAAIAGAAVEGIGHWMSNKFTTNDTKKKKKVYETFEKAMNEQPYRSASFRETLQRKDGDDEEEEAFHDAVEK